MYKILLTQKNRAPIANLSSASPRSVGPFYLVTYYVKWVKTSWAFNMLVK